jgi:putative chitobiose transport system permease protein
VVTACTPMASQTKPSTLPYPKPHALQKHGAFWHALLHGVLWVWCGLALWPLAWLVSTAITPPGGGPLTLAAFGQVFDQLPFGWFTLNSLALCALSVAATLVTSVLVAFPLGCLQFAGKPWVSALVLLSVVVPFQVLMIPLFFMCQHAGLTEANGWLPMVLGLTLPFWVSGFGIVLLRQAFAQLPTGLLDAAVLDGCSPWQQLWWVALPLIKPSLGLLAVLTFLSSWGELLWPSLLLSQPQHFPLSVGLVQLQGAFSSNWQWVAAGTVLGVVPVLIVFVVCQRLFLPVSTAGAEKG